MSFDLYFGRNDRTAPSASELTAYFKSTSNIRVQAEHPQAFQAWYENEDTGVYFSFDYETEVDTKEISEIISSEFTFANLTFNINYIRPTFFGMEAMPVVEAVCKEFALLVVDPQDYCPGRDKIAKHATAEELLTSWDKHNQSAVLAMEEDEELKFSKYYVPKAKSVFWWKYMFNKKKIEEPVAERDIFVPELLMLRKKDGTELSTTVIWNIPIAMVFPKCDIFLIGRRQTTNKDEEEFELKCYMPYSEVMAQIDKFLVPLEGPVPNLKMLEPELTYEIEEIFKERGEKAKGKFVRVPSDNFIDLDVQEIRKRSSKQ